ncbi:tryptophan synthase subunit alpha [Methanolobus sediminis]|uniref:Tryptophan synthase alpha chain n=1 Tax=Methanolobus sediminis TaxID=3072978 RepID=A0AA51UKQ7_9EURY|nr:tryptophan synthase subunit alpha [Methanolobus sediminis]WMW25359.1 tryptophan synthase subunit alpha [Methanolobus sediminis]
MRIADKFAELKEKNEKALIAYVCAGDPSAEATKEIVHALVKGGADIVELGLPFSDPVADGPTIQAASTRALEAGMNPDIYFEMAASIKENVPLVCMTYYNLIYKRGNEKFAKDCAEAGITGIIVPDLPAEEADELHVACKNNGVDLIFLITPVTTGKRMEKNLEKTSGFVYIVSRLGVTGERVDVAESTKNILARIDTEVPKAVGFGISNGQQAAEVIKAGADAVIVGSAFVSIIASGENVNERVEKLASELKISCR